jgi:transcriptional antiterminator RfaH
MPLLPLEPFVYPEDLLSASDLPAEDSRNWWVLHTRPRAEKTAAREFVRRGLSFFLPWYERQWRSRGRQLRSYMPLFPGYIFLQGDREARLQALQTNLLVRVLPVADQEQLHADLMRVHHLIQAGLPLTPEDRLEPGARVEIVGGPLAGLEGTFLKRRNQLKFFIEVQFLQRGVSVEVESWMVRYLSGPAPVLAGGGVCC